MTDILVADRETHVRQRRLLSHAFSEKALREQESILMMYINRFLEQLSARCTSGPLNMVAWFTFVSKAFQRRLYGELYLTLEPQLLTSLEI